jgi:glycosyltransferase involved in cell wall biosynthesis
VRPGVYDGGATYTLNVLHHLPPLLPEWRFIVLCREGEDRITPQENVELRPTSIRSASRRATFETVALSRLRADVFVSPNESLPLRLPAPAVVIAQNLAYHCPRAAASFRGGTAGQRFAAAAQAAYYRLRMPEAYSRAAVVVPISETAARILTKRTRLSPAKTIIARGGSDSIFLEPRPAEAHEAARLLVVSTVAPYKNFEVLVDALANVRASCPEVRLDVAGGDWRGYRANVEAQARRAGVHDAIVFRGPCGPSEVRALYATATVLLHLSECEACPLPPLEAMRSGVPVVAAERSSIPEILGGAARLVDPSDTSGVAAAVASLLADEKERSALRTLGRARAEELTWARTAAGVAEAIRRAAGVR